MAFFLFRAIGCRKFIVSGNGLTMRNRILAKFVCYITGSATSANIIVSTSDEAPIPASTCSATVNVIVLYVITVLAIALLITSLCFICFIGSCCLSATGSCSFASTITANKLIFISSRISTTAATACNDNGSVRIPVGIVPTVIFFVCWSLIIHRILLR